MPKPKLHQRRRSYTKSKSEIWPTACGMRLHKKYVRVRIKAGNPENCKRCEARIKSS